MSYGFTNGINSEHKTWLFYKDEEFRKIFVFGIGGVCAISLAGLRLFHGHSISFLDIAIAISAIAFTIFLTCGPDPLPVTELKNEKIIRPRTLDITDREVIIVLGSSGSGKTTLINHLCHGQIVEKSPSYPQIIEDEFLYCECSSFNDIVDTERSIIEAEETQKILSCAQITSILFLVEFEDIESGNGGKFLKNFKKLKLLLGDLYHFHAHILFIITKASSEAQSEDIGNKIFELMNLDKDLNYITKNKQYGKLIDCRNVILSGSYETVDSREAIELWITKKAAIRKFI